MTKGCSPGRVFAALNIIVAVFLCFHPGTAEGLSTEGLRMEVDGASGKIVELSRLEKGIDIKEIWIEFVDGKTGEEVRAGSINDFVSRHDAGAFEWQAESGAFRARNSIEDRSTHLSWKVDIENTGNEQQWLQVRLFSRAHAPGNLKFWDGEFERSHLAGRHATEEVAGLPLLALYCENRGIALGIDPNYNYLSYLENGFESRDGKSINLYYGTRVVVDAGDTETVHFVFYDFKSGYGHLNAVQRYHDAFRSVFSPAENIDPRIKLANDLYYGTYKPAKQELCRRSWHGFSWWYAPFKRPGDFYVRDEYWDWPEAEEFYREKRKHRMVTQRDRLNQTTDRRPFSPEGGNRGNLLDFEEFHRNREEFIRDSERNNNLAIMFYLANWTNRDLLEAKWPDMMANDDRFSNVYGAYVQHFSTPSSEIRTFWGGGFARSTKRDLEELVRDLNISGFAFDVASGLSRIYTEQKIDGLPGRGYDERGAFYATGIGINRIMEYIKTLEVNPSLGGPYTAGVATNGITRFSAFNTDVALIETGDVGESLNSIPRLMNHKFLLGHTHSAYHEAQATHILHNEIDWRDMSPGEIRDVYRLLYDGFLLSYYKLGLLPGGNLTFGAERLRKEMPRLMYLVSQGWEPLPAFKVFEKEDNFWLSRYGKGTGAYLVASNGGFDDIQAEFYVDNEFLGDYYFLFSDYDGAEVINRLKDGQTVVSANAKSRTPLVLKSLFGIKVDSGMDARLSSSGCAHAWEHLALIDARRESSAEMISSIPDNAEVLEMSLNGESIPYSRDEGCVRFRVDLKRGRNTVKVVYRSVLFHSEEKDLLGYRFVENEEPVCAIVISGSAGYMDSLAADRLQEYFNFYYAYADEDFQMRVKKGPAESEVDVTIPIFRFGEIGGGEKGNYVFLVTAGDKENISELFNIPVSSLETGIRLLEDRNSILIIGEDSEEVFRLNEKFMRVLDQKYRWIGFMHNGFHGEAREHFEKAGLFGGVLYECETGYEREAE